MEDKTIGQRIAAKRRELGLSQIDLGEQMGVSRQSVSKWEADAAIPEIDKLIALSKLFCVSVGWLLGVEEGGPSMEEETEFTDREWGLIDRLIQPQLPKWLVPLAAGTAAAAIFAVILAGCALFRANRYQKNLDTVTQAISGLIQESGMLHVDRNVLESHQLILSPSSDLKDCLVSFLGFPMAHAEGSEAELLIYLAGEELSRIPCSWDGSKYWADFILPVRSGYTASFVITGKSGTVRSTAVLDPVLNNMARAAEFGKIEAVFEKATHDGKSLTLTELALTVDVPDLMRDVEDLWTRCDLVVRADGEEVGRLDLLNRSAYSKQIDFSGGDVALVTQSQTISTGPLGGTAELTLFLDCSFSTGLELQKDLHSWTVLNNGLGNP